MGKRVFFVLFFFVCAVMVVFLPLAYATNGMKLIGVGEVQRAMGGASVGLPLDAAVTVSNPAGITQLGRRLDFGLTLFCPDVSYSARSSGGMVTVNDKIITDDSPISVIPAFGYIHPVNDKVTIGFGAYGVGGMGVDYEVNLYLNRTYTKHSFLKLAPTVAYAITDKLSVGIAPNISWGFLDYEAGSTAEVAHTDGSALGLGFTAGFFYQINDVFSFGVAYESEQRFRDYEFNTSGGKDKLDLNQPQSIAVGFGIRPSEKLRIALDAVWIDWPQAMGRNKPIYTLNSSGAALWDCNWDEQFVYKLGLEYDLTENVVLRFGYNYGKNPLDSSRAFETISFPAISEHHITGGLGLRLSEKFMLNASVVYSPESSFDAANAAQGINASTSRMSQISVGLGLSREF